MTSTAGSDGIDWSHMDALCSRLARERDRLSQAMSARPSAKRDNEIAFREREIASCKREIDGEYRFLGVEPVSIDRIMSDDELLGELGL
jgi:hypothetical protein